MSELGRSLLEVLGPRHGDLPEKVQPAKIVDALGEHDGGAILGWASHLGDQLSQVTSKGDRVLIDAPRGLPWLAAFVACVLAGRVAVPLAEGCPPAEVAALAERAGARAALLAVGSTVELPPGVAAISVDPGDRGGSGPGGLAAFGDPSDDGDAALFLFTSGTTGRPKAAVITHGNLVAQTRALREAWRLDARDVLAHALPLHHTHGVVVALLAVLLAGGRALVAPRFDPAWVWEALARSTLWMGVPTMYARLIEAFDAAPSPARARMSEAARALRLATSGSAALPVSLGERWRAIAGALPLERYGMTEIGMALGNPLAPAERRPGAVGHPLPSVEVRLVDEAGRDAGDGPGELWVRGPSVFAGYSGDAGATRESFADGQWFRTGDVATREAGSYRLLGRLSVDILKTGGEKVSALEIEEVLRELEDVAEVAVVGVPDAIWGDRVVAVIVPAPGRAAGCTPEAIRAFAKARLPPFKVPKDVELVDALPRNAMGKVQKTILVDRLGPPRQ